MAKNNKLRHDFKAAVYAGSFSPITRGHHDIILQAAKMFDRLYIVVGVNASKTPLFTMEERVAMIKHDVKHHIQPALKKENVHCDIRVVSHEGAVARFMEAANAPFYVRGLRLGMEFDTELPSVMVNKQIYPSFTPVFLCSTSAEMQIVSSTVARELCALGEDKTLGRYVTPHVKDKLIAKMKP